jgi:hypothetical protein
VLGRGGDGEVDFRPEKSFDSRFDDVVGEILIDLEERELSPISVYRPSGGLL